MSTQFTPGPWKVSRYNDLQYSIVTSAEGYSEEQISDAEGNANAFLIEAAPDMFAVIKELYDWSIAAGVKGPIFPKLEAAYLKATGQNSPVTNH